MLSPAHWLICSYTVSLLSISEKPTSNQSETGWQRSGYLYQNGFSDGYHLDSRVCSKPESFIILVVPVCGFKQSSRHVSCIACIWRFISRLKQKPLVKGPTKSHKHFFLDWRPKLLDSWPNYCLIFSAAVMKERWPLKRRQLAQLAWAIFRFMHC